MQHTLPEPTEMCFMCSRRWCERGRLVWLFCFVLTPEDRSDFSSTCLSERQMEKMVGDDDLVKRKVSWAIIKCALLAYKKKEKRKTEKPPRVHRDLNVLLLSPWVRATVKGKVQVFKAKDEKKITLRTPSPFHFSRYLFANKFYSSLAFMVVLCLHSEKK